MGMLDVVGKIVLREAAEDLIHLAVPDLALRSFSSLEKEISSLQRTADKLFQVQRVDVEEPIFLHIEVAANWEAELPRRIHEYWTFFHKDQRALDSMVFVLQPGEKKGHPRSHYHFETPLGQSLHFNFSLVCLWEVRAEDLINSASPGLLPLLPFTKGASPEKIYQAIERIEEVEDESRKRELRAGIFGTARLKYDDIDWLRHIGGKAALMGSKVYDEILEEGIEKGIEKGIEQGIEKERRSLLEQQLLQRLGDRVRPLLEGLRGLSSDALLKIALRFAAIRDDDELLDELRSALHS